MNVSLRYRDEVQGVSQPVLDEFDSLASQLQSIKLPTVEASAAMYASVSQAVAAGSHTPLVMDRRAFGSDEWFVTPNVITVPPLKDGIFLIIVQTFAYQSAGAVCGRVLELRINGVTERVSQRGVLNQPDGESLTLSLIHVAYLSAGDQVGLYGYCDGPTAVFGASDPTLGTRMTVLRLSS